MKLLFCINKDIHTYHFLRTLSTYLDIRQATVMFTKSVGEKSINNLYLEYLNLFKVQIPDSIEEKSPEPFYFKELEKKFDLKMTDVSHFKRSELLQSISDEFPDLILSVRFCRIFNNAMIAVPK